MTIGWEKRPLAEVCEVEYGTRVVQKKHGGTIYPVYGGGGATFAMDASNRQDRVVIGRFGMSSQCTRFVFGKFFLNDSGLTLSPKDPTSLLPAFLDKWAFSVNDDIFALGKGTAQKNLDVTAFRCMTVPVPPLAEQQRIVGILDEAFEGVATAKANAEKNLQNARALFESHLQSVFTQRGEGWEEWRIPDLCSTFGRGKSRHRPRNEPSLYGGSYPFIQTGDLSNADHVVTTYSQTYSDKGLAQSKLWPSGTVGIAIVGATIGETGVLGFDACFPDSVIGMTVDPTKADAFFIEYMLQHFKDVVKSQGEGSARDNINLATFDRLLFPIPSVSKQRSIVEKIDALKIETQRLTRIYERKLAAMDELKKSLLHHAFSGKLD
jgi:type I restriction enzyme S subunit